jgi:hypothetical protein
LVEKDLNARGKVFGVKIASGNSQESPLLQTGLQRCGDGVAGGDSNPSPCAGIGNGYQKGKVAPSPINLAITSVICYNLSVFRPS